MLGPYRRILATPGALAFSSAGVLARLEMAMIGLGTVLLVQRTTGSYALAGAVAATGGTSLAATTPLVAGLIDRHGQAGVLRPAVVAHVAALVLLTALATFRAPVWTLFPAAALTGAAQPAIGGLVRARWSALLTGSPGLQTAFALESVLDEVVFIAGPVIVTLLAALVHPALALLVAAATSLAGALLLAAQRGTEPVARAAAHDAATASSAVLRVRGMVALIALFVATGSIFGGAEVSVAAFAREQAAPAAAGLVLALWATGSMTAGLIYGAIAWRGRLERRLLVCVAVLAAGTVPMLLAPTLPLLAAVFLVAGAGIAPVMVAGTAVVERMVPRGRLTEGLAWTGTGINLSYAACTAVAGAVIDAGGARAGFAVPVAGGLLALFAALAVVHRTGLRPAAG